MTNSEDSPKPRPRAGRLFWLAGLALGILSGAFVAVQLVSASSPMAH